jgi:hypothetical protein
VKKPIRVYADTSVFGGCFDPEFDVASLRFFEQVRDRSFILVVSGVTLDELDLAPEPVRRILAEMDESCVERAAMTPECEALAREYLDAKVVGPACVNDARHIAVATIMDVDIVVSWNFKHIVHFEKIMGYEGINLTRGYRSPRIHSPMELVEL